jgi:hypothetical protein
VDSGAPGDARPDGTRGDSGSRDGSRVDTGAPEDANDDGGEDAGDAAEEAAACLPQSPDSATGLFVVVGGSTSTSCGSLAKPCATLALALEVAAGSPSVTTLYVGPGKYPQAKTLVLSSGIAIVGGWDVLGKTWTHDCIPPEISGPSPVLSATSLGSPTTLDTLDIVETEAAGAGGSVYGITSLDSTLMLRDVSVTVPGGGAGTDATVVGGAGSPGAAGGCKDPSSGASGAEGDGGAASDPGVFKTPPECYVNTNNAMAGGPGEIGSVGTPGGPGEVEVGVSSCVVGYSTCVATPGTYQGGTGKPGCPGGGGQGGSPGSSGGCSVAVYTWGGSVTIVGGALRTGNGGRGGDATSGGDGGAGAKGAEGTATKYVATCTHTTPYHCAEPSAYADGGKAGGPGGNGGPGGPGGGGAGGCSFGYFIGADASVTAADASIANGSGGPGGTPNGSIGPSGEHN